MKSDYFVSLLLSRFMFVCNMNIDKKNFFIFFLLTKTMFYINEHKQFI